MNFAGLAPFVLAEAPGGADVLLVDLGLSSMQIDDPARGFTFKADGPLDMRMNPERGRSASELLSGLGVAGLTRLLVENADEPLAAELAEAILPGPRGPAAGDDPGARRGRPGRLFPASPDAARRPTTRSAGSSRRSGSP